MGKLELGRFGLWTLGLDSHRHTEICAVARAIEEMGYGCLWVPDFVGRDPFVTASQILAATQTLRVGTAVASIHGRTPLAMAAAQRTLEVDFPGRFVLGVGASHASLAQNLHQSPYAKPVSMLRNYLEGLDRAGAMLSIWPEGGQTSAGDQIQRVGSGETTSHGVRIPRLIAGNGPHMMGLSKTHADGLIPVNSPDEQTIRARLAIGPDKFLLSGATVMMEADPIKARSVARRHIAGSLALPNYSNNVRRFGFADDDFRNGGSDRLVDALVAWGDVDSISARLQSHFEKGADHVSITMIPTHGILLDEWRRLAEALNIKGGRFKSVDVTSHLAPSSTV